MSGTETRSLHENRVTLGCFEVAGGVFALDVSQLGPDEGEVGDGGVGDPHFVAVEQVSAVDGARDGAHGAWIAAAVGLGESKATDFFAPGEPREPPDLLCLRPKGADREHNQGPLNRGKAPEPAISALKFLHDKPVGDLGNPGTTVPLKIRPQNSQLPKPRDEG